MKLEYNAEEVVAEDIYNLFTSLVIKYLVLCHLASGGDYSIEMDNSIIWKAFLLFIDLYINFLEEKKWFLNLTEHLLSMHWDDNIFSLLVLVIIRLYKYSTALEFLE